MTTLQLGCYSQETPFEIKRHGYCAAPTSYMQVLEVLDPPTGRHPIVLAYFGGVTGTHKYVEFETADAAVRQCNRLEWGSGRIEAKDYYPACAGFIRYVELDPGELPWFYGEDPG